jgi:hypothetical protein
MVIDSMTLYWIESLSNAVLFVLGAVLFRHALLLLPQGAASRRVRSLSQSLVSRTVPDTVRVILFIRGKGNKLSELQSLLAGSGIAVDPILFEAVRRVLIGIAAAVGWLGYLAFQTPALTLHIQPIFVLAASIVMLVPLLGYKIVLQSFKRGRSHRIVKEIYILSNQLLYYSNSKMNLHSKLFRCVPFTRTIRPALQILLNEWYQDADIALKRFKIRLGTDEAYGFAETMNSLRLGENGSYYELLRERIDDYKQKIDMQRESRKETVSYMLFVLAGLPILNTFRLFLYPWVMEGQRLFQTLN